MTRHGWIKGLVVGIAAVMLLGCWGCSDTDFSSIPWAAIEVVDPNGMSHLDANPVLALNFGLLEYGQDALQTLEIHSQGEGALTIDEVCLVVATDLNAAQAAFCDDGASPFSFVAPTAPIEPGSSASLPVAFTSGGAGEHRTYLRILSNARNDPVVHVLLTGTGEDLPVAFIEVVDPDGNSHLNADPVLDLSFGLVPIVETTEQILTVHSRGTAPLEINEVCLVMAGRLEEAQVAPCYDGASPFAFTEPVSPIDPGDSSELPVSFAPEALQNYKVYLRIGSNAGNDPVVHVLLYGAGQEVEICNVETIIELDEVFEASPMDIVWVVDSSGSMDFENTLVQNNLNTFSQRITASGIDHRVIVIGSTDYIQVPPPLGGSPDFRHVDYSVDSNEGLEAIISQYSQYSDFLREDTVKHLVAVTDDESDMSSAEFQNEVATLGAPGFGTDWVFHSIVGFGTIPYIGCITAARRGDQYIDLSQQTSGTIAAVCEIDYSPVFDAIEASVIEHADILCTFEVPDVIGGIIPDPSGVILEYLSPGGLETPLHLVLDEAHCDALGWYLDFSGIIPVVVICPEACDMLKNEGGGWVRVAYDYECEP
jgi:hypothetical protein